MEKKLLKLAVIGATGLVGKTLIQLLEHRKFPLEKLILAASGTSEGAALNFKGQPQLLVTISEALAAKPDLAIFAVENELSLVWAPRFLAAGIKVIDNASTWRLHHTYKLIVPEVNMHILSAEDQLIANPNCSTILMLTALAPLHRAYTLKRLVISTYQSVTGSGKKGVEQLLAERTNQTVAEPAYPHPIDLNLIPHIDKGLPNGYTKEEMKLVDETQKILGTKLGITATAVRVPTLGGHAMAVNATFQHAFPLPEAILFLKNSHGILIQNQLDANLYPMPITVADQDAVFIGRIRKDESEPNTLNLWIAGDSLRKGAATNAIQIAEYLYQKGWF